MKTERSTILQNVTNHSPMTFRRKGFAHVKPQIPGVKVEIIDAKVTQSLTIPDMNPYLVISIGQDLKKTRTSSAGYGPIFVFNQSLEFKSIQGTRMSITFYSKTNQYLKDIYIGSSEIEISNYCKNENEAIELKIFDTVDQQAAIVRLFIKILEDVNTSKERHDQRRHTECIDNLGLSLSFYGSQHTEQKERASKNKNTSFQEQRKVSVVSKGDSSMTDLSRVLKSQISLQNSVIKYANIHDYSTNENKENMNIGDIEKLKSELIEERNKIRIQENFLGKLLKKLKTKESEIEEEKKNVQMRKDTLTQQELALLDERKKWTELLNQYREQKKHHEEQKQNIVNEIENINENTIIIRAKNSIIEKKITDYVTKLHDLNYRRDYLINQIPDGFDLEEQPSVNIPVDIPWNSCKKPARNQKPANKRKRSVDIKYNTLENPKTIDNNPILDRENYILKIRLEKTKVKVLQKEVIEHINLEEKLLASACHLERQRSRPLLSRIKNNSTKSSEQPPPSSTLQKKNKPTYSLMDKYFRPLRNSSYTKLSTRSHNVSDIVSARKNSDKTINTNVSLNSSSITPKDSHNKSKSYLSTKLSLAPKNQKTFSSISNH